MNKYEKLNELLKKGNGYLFTSEVEKNEISRTYMAKFVRDNNLEKVAKGIYIHGKMNCIFYKSGILELYFQGKQRCICME